MRSGPCTKIWSLAGAVSGHIRVEEMRLRKKLSKKFSKNSAAVEENIEQ